MTVKPNALPWLWLALLVIALDQASKYWIQQVLTPGQLVPLIHGVLYGTLAYNTGAAFSFLADSTGWQRWFFLVLALAVSVVITGWLRRTPRHDWRSAAPLALIVGGALGNAVDRLLFGKVTDFILVYIGSWPFPAFNFADSAISVGAVALVLFSLFGDGDRSAVR